MSVKDSVLSTLQKNRGDYVSGESISGDLGVSRAAVWKAIRSLRDEGYRINAVTNRGYSLAGEGSGITADEIRSHLPARYKGNGIYVYGVLDSTNIKARQMADGAADRTADGAADRTADGTADRTTDGTTDRTADGTADRTTGRSGSADIHGSIIVAGQQTAGKGRLGRSFFSPVEGIYMSMVIRPDFDLSRSTLVTVAAAAAVAEAIDEVCGQKEETRIKWVNDIYLGGGKICGILTEGVSDFESGRIESLIVGIGINTTTDGFPEELKKTAGAVEGEWSRPELIAAVASRLLDNVSGIGSIAPGAGSTSPGDGSTSPGDGSTAPGAGEASPPDKDAHPFMKTYRKKSMLIGRDVLVFRGTYREDPTKEMDGIPAKVNGIDDDGGLMVTYEDGSTETLTTGEVSIRTADGNRD